MVTIDGKLASRNILYVCVAGAEKKKRNESSLSHLRVYCTSYSMHWIQYRTVPYRPWLSYIHSMELDYCSSSNCCDPTRCHTITMKERGLGRRERQVTSQRSHSACCSAQQCTVACPHPVLIVQPITETKK
jgi:hypothetical protein